jgi:homoserine dehydrogenase
MLIIRFSDCQEVIISFRSQLPDTKYAVGCKGPGAGAEVTAAGVFADLVRVTAQ